MARIVVVNPVSRTQRRRTKNKRHHVKGYYPNPRKKRRFSAKARAAAIRNLAKARRPKRLRRHARQHAKRHAKRRVSKTFVNPFSGTLALMNPKRKRRHYMARKKNHRRHHRRALSNPFSANALLATPKEMISSQFIMEAAGVASGFVLPNLVMNYLPTTWRASKLTYYASKVATIAVLSAAGTMVSKRVSKFILVGGGVSILMDLYTEVMGAMGTTATTPAATAPAAHAYYGDGMSAYYGAGISSAGVGDFDIP